jgi:hypothetical protein
LCNTRLLRKGIQVVRYNIEHLIKLSQRLGETTNYHVGLGVLSEQGDVARVKPLSFVEVRLAPVPLTSPSRDIGQRFGNLAAIRQELTCLLKVTHGGVVIFQAGVVVISPGHYGLAEIGLKSERRFSCLPRFFAEGNRWLKSECEIAERIDI